MGLIFDTSFLLCRPSGIPVKGKECQHGVPLPQISLRRRTSGYEDDVALLQLSSSPSAVSGSSRSPSPLVQLSGRDLFAIEEDAASITSSMTSTSVDSSESQSDSKRLGQSADKAEGDRQLLHGGVECRRAGRRQKRGTGPREGTEAIPPRRQRRSPCVQKEPVRWHVQPEGPGGERVRGSSRQAVYRQALQPHRPQGNAEQRHARESRVQRDDPRDRPLARENSLRRPQWVVGIECSWPRRGPNLGARASPLAATWRSRSDAWRAWPCGPGTGPWCVSSVKACWSARRGWPATGRVASSSRMRRPTEWAIFSPAGEFLRYLCHLPATPQRNGKLPSRKDSNESAKKVNSSKSDSNSSSNSSNNDGDSSSDANEEEEVSADEAKLMKASSYGKGAERKHGHENPAVSFAAATSKGSQGRYVTRQTTDPRGTDPNRDEKTAPATTAVGNGDLTTTSASAAKEDDSEPYIFSDPRYVCVTASGKIIVSDSGRSRSQSLSPLRGTYLHAIGRYGNRDGQLKVPYGVCSDQQEKRVHRRSLQRPSQRLLHRRSLSPARADGDLRAVAAQECCYSACACPEVVHRSWRSEVDWNSRVSLGDRPA